MIHLLYSFLPFLIPLFLSFVTLDNQGFYHSKQKGIDPEGCSKMETDNRAQFSCLPLLPSGGITWNYLKVKLLFPQCHQQTISQMQSNKTITIKNILNYVTKLCAIINYWGKKELVERPVISLCICIKVVF